jgi:hypothetical protein
VTVVAGDIAPIAERSIGGPRFNYRDRSENSAFDPYFTVEI